MSVGRNSSSQSSTGSSSGHSMGYNESGGISLGGSTSTSSGSSWNSSKSTPGFMTELGTILQRNLDGTGEFSKNQAIADVQGVIRTQAQDALQSALPSIARVNRGAGAYNTTTNTLLENDLASRVNAQLANTQLEAIKSYGQLGNQQIAAFSGATQAGTTTESSGGSSQSSQSDQQNIALNAALGLQEALNQGQNESRGSGSGFNVGLPSPSSSPSVRADGGVIPKKRTEDEKQNSKDLASRSLLEFGSSPFSLFNEFFNFDGKGGRKSGLTILPTLAALVGLDTGNTTTTAATETATDKPAETKNADDEIDNVLRISQGALDFMKLNGLKTLDDTLKTIADATATGNIFNMKGIDTIGGVKEFQSVAPRVAEIVYGHREPGAGAYADGGKIMDATTLFQNLIQRLAPQNIFEQTRQRREQEAGTQPSTKDQNRGGVVINVNTGPSQEPYGGFERPGGTLPGRADGGQIEDDNNLAAAIRHYAMSGTAPSLASRTDSAGKITGPQSRSGRDNQLVAVGGGEGVIPKDVMEVDGVPQLLQQLIQKYHTPVK